MNTLKFKPEGWNNEISKLDFECIDESIENRKIMQGLVNKCDENYNLYVNLNSNITGIMPREEIEAINLEEDNLPKKNLCVGKVHKFIQFKIKQKKDDNTVIISRKDVQEEALNWIKTDLQVGQRVNGIVKSIKPYGAFIEIGGGVVGLFHIEDLSVARIKTPYERLKIGQKVETVVKSIDRNTGKVILSYKELLGTWEENAKKFEQGMRTQGIVRETEKNNNGIFIELNPNLVGMAEYQEGLKYGEKVNVYIRKIDTIKKKIKLNII